MSHQVISLKYRPQRFEDVIGQDHITLTLKNAIEKGRLGHAYIFSGPRGTGKTTTARLLAKMVNCENPKNGNPCNECISCREITDGRSLDVLEIDGASNRGIDSIRDLREQVKYPPTRGKYKVYIIDEFHQITKDAFNALLKTLEEPPRHILFIFATTELHKVLPTILSRCQRFEFKRIPLAEVMDLLRAIAEQEGIKIDDDSLLLIAKKGDGSVRDSQSILEQVIAFSDGKINYDSILSILGLIREEVFFDMFRALSEGRADKALKLINDMLMQGYDLLEFVTMFSVFLRDLYMVRASGSADVLNTVENLKKDYAELAKTQDEHALIRMLTIVNDELSRISKSANVKILVETLFIKLSKIADLQQLDEVIGQVKSAEHMAHPIAHNKPAQVKKTPAEAPEKSPQHTSTQTSLPSPSPAQPKKSLAQATTTQAARVKISDKKETANTGKLSSDYHSPILNRKAPSALDKEESPAEVLSSPPLPHQKGVKISFDDIKDSWPDIIENLATVKPSLASMLESAGIQKLDANDFFILVEDEFSLETLRQNENIISASIQKKLGASLKIHVEKRKVDDSQRVIKKKEMDEAAKQIISGFDAELV
ncbi:MAG: DNA polymerase III subunit gamma/tau [Candidatus Neomarinimicrobiota bacterium]